MSPSLGRVQGEGPGSEAPLSIRPPVCLDDTFGPDCSLTCDDCRNGGTCLPTLDSCDCPDGWTGLVCNESEAAMGAGLCGGQGPGALGPAWHGQSTPPTVLGRGFLGPSIHSFLQGLPAAFSTPGPLLGAVRPWGLAEPGVCPSEMFRSMRVQPQASQQLTETKRGLMKSSGWAGQSCSSLRGDR